jgi:hypothetical protein
LSWSTRAGESSSSMATSRIERSSCLGELPDRLAQNDRCLLEPVGALPCRQARWTFACVGRVRWKTVTSSARSASSPQRASASRIRSCAWRGSSAASPAGAGWRHCVVGRPAPLRGVIIQFTPLSCRFVVPAVCRPGRRGCRRADHCRPPAAISQNHP